MKRFLAVAVVSTFLLPGAAFAGGREAFEKKCTRCHGASKTEALKAQKDYWQSLVQRMQKKRSNFIPDADAVQIVAFLSETYGPK